MSRTLLSGEELQGYEAGGFVALGPVLDEDDRLALLDAEQHHRNKPVLAGRHSWMVLGEAARDPEPG